MHSCNPSNLSIWQNHLFIANDPYPNRCTQLCYLWPGVGRARENRWRHWLVWRRLCENQRQTTREAIWHQQVPSPHVLQVFIVFVDSRKWVIRTEYPILAGKRSRSSTMAIWWTRKVCWTSSHRWRPWICPIALRKWTRKFWPKSSKTPTTWPSCSVSIDGTAITMTIRRGELMPRCNRSAVSIEWRTILDMAIRLREPYTFEFVEYHVEIMYI